MRFKDLDTDQRYVLCLGPSDSFFLNELDFLAFNYKLEKFEILHQLPGADLNEYTFMTVDELKEGFQFIKKEFFSDKKHWKEAKKILKRSIMKAEYFGDWHY